MLTIRRLAGQARQVPSHHLIRLAFSSSQALETRGISKDKLENLAPDRILLKGLSFFGKHGVLPEETSLGQRFEVDATLYCDLQSAGCGDDLHATTDYAAVHSNIREVVEGKPSLLIETVAENIAKKVLSNHRMVLGVRVAVRKPHVAIAGMFDSMGVEVRRVRSI